MGEFNEHHSTFIQKSCLLFYASCAVTSLLIGTSFCLFALHQIRLDRIESTINDIQDTFAKLDSVEKNAGNHAVDLLHRYARQTDSDNVDNPSSVDMDKLLEEIIKLQLRSLRAQCLSNQKICIQGPKGSVGDKGDNGRRGPQGKKGETGTIGIQGEKGERGDVGARGTSIDPPFITRSPVSVTVLQKGLAVFECEARGTPNPTISWRRLDNSTLPKLRASVLLTNALKIVDVQQEDAGSYVCEAKNVFGLEQAYATLAVQAPPSFIKVSSDVVSVFPGDDVKLDCSTSGYPIPTITWSRVDDLPKSSKIEKNGTLILRNVTQSDVGQYICTAQNDIAKKAHSLTLTIDLNNIPTLPGEAVVNTDALLKCHLCSIRGYSLTWEKIGGSLPAERTTQKGCTLIIKNTTLDDSGRYACIATKQTGEKLRHEVPFTVIAPPRITSPISPIVAVRSQGELELRCAAVGPPSPDIYWTRGSQRLTSNKTGFLQIKNMSQLSVGFYRCHAVNRLGQDVRTTQIVISQLQFVERPPSTISVNDTSKTIVVNCTATVASELLIHTHWSINRNGFRCDKKSEKFKSIWFFTNGTMVIPNANRCAAGVYNCSAQHDKEMISTSMQIIDTLTGWMLTSDSCGGFRQSTYDRSVRYAVSLSNVWDKSKIYDCPFGYHWASTEEGQKIFKNYGNKSGVYVYYGQCNWSGYDWGGKTRYIFRFRDSASTNAYKHAGLNDEYQVEYSSTTSSFAGIVCIEN
ncbi:roundabout homolog 1-like [Corticium candelabrum]|uniref:roundabout homolog 1-like n=1 Tax=Corticium candelabrum TaxID=121492 RepID=UPI002E25642D|nr:roundabout homolog 1-like [Corticium candelabrum]